MCYEEHGFSYDDAGFDWSKASLPGNLFKTNLARKEPLKEGIGLGLLAVKEEWVGGIVNKTSDGF